MTDTRRTATSRTKPTEDDMERRLRSAAADYVAAAQALRDTRLRLQRAIREADQNRWRQVDILRATDNVWTREMVRRVCGADEES